MRRRIVINNSTINNNDEWYDIPKYKGLYIINKKGEIIKLLNGKRMSLSTDRNGYKFYRLTNTEGKRRTELQHRLVAKVFIPNPDNLPEINHIDENKSNNSIENLEWCTRQYNVKYGNRINKMKEKTSKKVYCYYLNGLLDKDYSSVEETKKDGYEPKHVSDCALGKRKTHKQRKWSYENLKNKGDIKIMKRNKILHVFQWKIKDVILQLDRIKEQGFNMIQLTPIMPCKEGAWWGFYQGFDFTIGNKTGTREDLIELCSKAHSKGIKVIMDVVLRHVAGNDKGELIPHEKVADRIKNNPNFFTNAKNSTNYKDRHEAITMAFGMPMLNYNNAQLQSIYIEFLQELANCKVDGYRIDMGKHFGLVEEGSSFWNNVFGKFSDMFNYAECLECEKPLLDKYTRFINVLTDGSCTDKSKQIIYVNSHDTEETWGFTKKMTDKMIEDEWEILLRNNPTSHVLFYCRPMNNAWKSDRLKYINSKY